MRAEAGQAGADAKPNGSGAAKNGKGEAEKPAILNDRGLMMPAFRDRLDIALKPERAPEFPIDALPTLMADMVRR